MKRSPMRPKSRPRKPLAIQRHMTRVAALGCCLCRRLGYGESPAELHHPREGTGAGQRAADDAVIPLCPAHHRGPAGVHGLGTKAFAREYGVTEWDLLGEVRAQLGIEVAA